MLHYNFTVNLLQNQDYEIIKDADDSSRKNDEFQHSAVVRDNDFDLQSYIPYVSIMYI
jgi:hypothetical protein